jgi:hypothetical protein
MAATVSYLGGDSPPATSSASNLTTGPEGDSTNKVTPHQKWQSEIDYAEKELDKFYTRGRKVVKRWLDERDAVDAPQKWFNLYFANTNILKAALYAQMPQPEVERKWSDYQDDVGRTAAIILKRSITPDRDDPRDLFDCTMRNVVYDRLVPGLGAAWLRLETDTEDVELQLEASVDPGEETPLGEATGMDPYMGFQTGPSPDDPMKSLQAQLALDQPPQPAQQQPPQPGGMPLGAQPQPGMPPQGPPQVPPQPPVQPQPQLQAQPQAMGPAANAKTFKRITDQRVVVEYVYWEDFIWSPCRVWEERRWVGRWVYMTRDALVKRFGEKIGRRVPLKGKPKSKINQVTPKNMAQETARVCEIWDRVNRKVVWFCPDCDYLLDTKDDFLKLVGFEPCPSPMLANVSTSNTAPRPDYYMIQDQYSELDTVNNRISLLTQACKVVGVYDRGSEGVQRMLQEGFENQLIPVDNWAMFAEKGGIKGQIDWLPLDQVILTLKQMYENREATKQQIYELTGISDIVRGASKASETLGAQEIKAKFASVRIKDIQDEVASFASEILRLKAEIMVKHFDPEILRRKSNIMRTDDASLADDALGLLQSEEGFEWRISVTSDQMAQADYDMEKQDRIELLTSVSGYMEKAGAMLMQMPQAGPLIVGMLKWVVAGFKGARDIEGMLDRELDAMIRQPPEDKPDPEAQKAQLEQQATQQQMQADQQKNQMDLQKSQQDAALKQQLGEMELRMKQMELQFKERELAMKERESRMNLQFAQAESEQKQLNQVRQQELDLQSSAQSHAQEQQFAAQQHEQAMEHQDAAASQAAKQSDAAAAAKVDQVKALAKAKPQPKSKG